MVKKYVFLPTLMTCVAYTIDFSQNLIAYQRKTLQELSDVFIRFFIAIIVTDLARKNKKTVLFYQNGQNFGNSTFFNLEGIDPRS